jgi:hypothetical protein
MRVFILRVLGEELEETSRPQSNIIQDITG